MATFNFEHIAERVLHGELRGYFILRNQERVSGGMLSRNSCPILGYDYPYQFSNGKTYTPSGAYQYGDKTTPFDVVDFHEISY